MKNLTLKNAISACSGKYVGPDSLLNTEITAVVIDSRKACEGSLFAAISGERTDGHLYINSALEHGAICALAEHAPEDCRSPLIIVSDVQDALQSIAAFYRQQFDIPFIGITGSVGKTTAKEMIACVLSRRFRVLKTEGNFNNDLGVPLTIFNLRPEHEIAVIEMGISHFGDMRRLTQIVRPSCALFTLIGSAHLEFLENRAGVLRAKAEILEGMDNSGIVIVNGDDDLLQSLRCVQRRISFGLNDKCDVSAGNVSVTAAKGTKCIINAGERHIPAAIDAYGEHMAYAAAEGAAVGILYGLSDDEIAEGISSYRAIGSRSRVVDTAKIRLIDDCYNANPTSMSSALRSLSRTSGRTVCILGDMLELGPDEKELHLEIGHLAHQLGIELVLTVGSLAAEIYRGAGAKARHFDSVDSLLRELPMLISPGDTVLVKASHSMHFEQICAFLESF